MQIENYILDAVDRVLSWEIPSEALTQAVRQQAALMAKISPDQIYTSGLD